AVASRVAMGLSRIQRDARSIPQSQLEQDHSTVSGTAQDECCQRGELVFASEALEPFADPGIYAVSELRSPAVRVLSRLEVPHERARAQMRHFLARSAYHGHVRGDQADAFPVAILGREPLQERVRVRRVADLECAEGAVVTDPVEDDHSERAADGGEARKVVRELTDILVVTRVEQVEAVEEIEGRLS